MSIALDAIYAVVAAATTPWWMRKARSGWAERFGDVETLAESRSGRPRLLLHAVSVGEVNLCRPMVDALAAKVDLVVSATTDTGIARARELFSGKCHVTRFPLDASWSVRKFLDRVKPSAVGLVELELWPNFAAACRRRGIPMAVVNGRLSERSFKRYRLGRFYMGRSFRQLDFAAVQDDTYAARFIEMGVAREKCIVAGSMKWDAATVADTVSGAEQLRAEMGIDPTRPLVVAGSTAPGEHELLVEACPPGVQLLCAPRRPEWWDQAADVLAGCVRRSKPGTGSSGSGRFLLDTIGELRKAYALADVVVVGRSFGALYGSDPMEPAALGKPVVIGPAVADFQSMVETMERAGAIVRTDAAGLKNVLTRLFADAGERARLGSAARRCVVENQGATHRTVELLLELVGASEKAPDVGTRVRGLSEMGSA